MNPKLYGTSALIFVRAFIYFYCSFTAVIRVNREARHRGPGSTGHCVDQGSTTVDDRFGGMADLPLIQTYKADFR